MSFSIALKPLTGECNRIDEFREGVEFSLQLLSKPEEWIPIRYLYYNNIDDSTLQSIIIGEPGHKFRLRGYNKVEQSNSSNGLNKFEIQICNFSLSDSLQFRWLQT